MTRSAVCRPKSTFNDKGTTVEWPFLAFGIRNQGGQDQAARLETVNGQGKPWTKQEKESGADGTRSLTEDEPAPQTIYYPHSCGSKDPVLLKVQLQYASTKLPVKKRH